MAAIPNGSLKASLPQRQPRLSNGYDSEAADEVNRGDCQEKVCQVVLSTWFDIGISCIILLNAVAISAEQSLEIHGHDTSWLRTTEHVFLVLYILEIGLRVYGLGWYKCLKDRWVQLDFSLVFLGVVSVWIIDPATDGDGTFTPLVLLRMTRLLRVAKTARLFVRIHEFWMLVRGLMSSASIILWTCVILLVVIYLFASVGLEIITKHNLDGGAYDDEEYRAHVNKYFRSLPIAMLTLVQFLCMDDLSIIYRPLVEKHAWMMLYFGALIMVVSVLLMNLITAVILSSTLDQNNSEQDAIKAAQKEEWTRRLGDIKALFTRLDQDDSGLIDREEIMNLSDSDKEMLCEALEVSDPKEIFNSLDRNKTGVVSLQEFSDRILDMVVGKGPVDLKRMERQIEMMHWRLRDMFSVHMDGPKDPFMVRKDGLAASSEAAQKPANNTANNKEPTAGSEPEGNGNANLLKQAAMLRRQSSRAALSAFVNVDVDDLVAKVSHIWEESLADLKQLMSDNAGNRADDARRESNSNSVETASAGRSKPKSRSPRRPQQQLDSSAERRSIMSVAAQSSDASPTRERKSVAQGQRQPRYVPSSQVEPSPMRALLRAIHDQHLQEKAEVADDSSRGNPDVLIAMQSPEQQYVRAGKPNHDLKDHRRLTHAL